MRVRCQMLTFSIDDRNVKHVTHREAIADPLHQVPLACHNRRSGIDAGHVGASRAMLGSSGGISQPLPGRILLHVGMRDMATRATWTDLGVTSAPRRAASRSKAGRVLVPRVSAGHPWHSPSPAWPGSPASRRRWWLKAWDGASAWIRYQVPVVVEYSAAGFDLGLRHRHDRQPCVSRWLTVCW